MNELLSNIFTAGKPADLIADTHSRLASRRHAAWLSLNQVRGTPVTIVEATGSTHKSIHARGWGTLRRIRDSGGCIGFNTTTTGGLNNRAQIRVIRDIQVTDDCGNCTGIKAGCPINMALASAHKHSRTEFT